MKLIRGESAFYSAFATDTRHREIFLLYDDLQRAVAADIERRSLWAEYAGVESGSFQRIGVRYRKIDRRAPFMLNGRPCP